MTRIPTKRVFDGTIYYSVGRYDTRQQAQRAAKDLRRHEHNARVVFVYDVGYVVFAVSR